MTITNEAQLANGLETCAPVEPSVRNQKRMHENCEVRDKMRPIMEKAQTHVNQLVTQYQRYKEKK